MEDFKTMAKMVAEPRIALAYCDYIAYLIQKELKAVDNNDQRLLSSVGRARMDLDASGALASTKKTIEVEDRQGKKYKITVEEV
jgi:hypothetical protein